MDYAQFLIDDQYLINYVIYRFKNKINGKVYIGQTTKSLRKRVTQHITNSRPNTKAHKTYFHNALNKQGNLRRDILSNNRKGKLGFTKKGSIWSYYSPNERRAY